jgi:6-phosphofructokinase
MKNNIFYAQSGGVTAVINATAYAVIDETRRLALQGAAVGRVLIGHEGILGGLEESLVDTAHLSEEEVQRLCYLPGGAFGSCRQGLPDFEIDPAPYHRLAEVFHAHGIGFVLYNGGGGSADTAEKMALHMGKIGCAVKVVGIPKTIDNDMLMTDCSPGFGSVAKYAATSFREASLDIASMSRTSTKVFVLEVMGRQAGWIAAACALSQHDHEESPEIILFPEIPFNREKFLQRVKIIVERHGYCVIAAAEGLQDQAGKILAMSGDRDALGRPQLGGVAPLLAHWITDRWGYKHHWAVSDYQQRSARHLASATDFRQAVAVGRMATRWAVAGKTGVIPMIRRLSDSPYRWDVVEVPLSQVARKERKLPASFIREDGFGITTDCRHYLLPLISGENYPPFVQGLPDYRPLKLTFVPKFLPPYSNPRHNV